jgi:hypothetical protein
MSEASDQRGCAYRLLDSGIHEFVFLDNDKQSLDDFFVKLEHILRETSHTAVAHYLVDIAHASRDVSLVGLTQRFRRMETQIPHRPSGRTVVLHKPGFMLTFIDGFIRALAPSRDETRFFPVHQREDAIRWLLSE